MLAQLKTVVLIKEAIKLAFFRLVEYLEHQHLWGWLQAQNGQKQSPSFWNSSVYSCSEKCEKLPRNWRSGTTLCTTPFTEQLKLALTRIERGVGGPGAQLSKRTSTLECLVWETDTTSPQLAASLNSTRKTPVSMSTVKRWLQDAGVLGRVLLNFIGQSEMSFSLQLCLEGQHPEWPLHCWRWDWCFESTI